MKWGARVLRVRSVSREEARLFAQDCETSGFADLLALSNCVRGVSIIGFLWIFIISFYTLCIKRTANQNFTGRLVSQNLTDSCLLHKMRVSCSACADWPRALQKHMQRATQNSPGVNLQQVTLGRDAERQLT